MSSRIQQLEEALSNVQGVISADIHPLLQTPDDGDERALSPIPIAAAIEPNASTTQSPDELSKALGTLTIRPYDESQFHGETASSEVSQFFY